VYLILFCVNCNISSLNSYISNHPWQIIKGVFAPINNGAYELKSRNLTEDEKRALLSFMRVLN